MVSIEKFTKVISKIQDNYKNIFTNQDDVLGVELEKDIVMTYLFTVLKDLQKCNNTYFLLEGYLFNGIPIDIKNMYNIYSAEVERLEI